MSSRRYRPDRELEIYKFRVVLELQISKKLDLLMIYKICLQLMFCFVTNEVFWRFGELSSIQARSGNRDL